MQRASIESAGLPLSYLTWPAVPGASDASDTVLLLHGFLDLAHGMTPLVRALRERGLGARLLAPDWRGHGDSGWIGSGGYYHFVDYVADLATLVDGLCAPAAGHLFVLGHSMGGTASALYAGTFPEHLSGLINVEGLGPPADSAANAPERTRSWALAWRRAAGRRLERSSLASIAEAAERLRRTSPRLEPAFALELAEAATRDDGRGGRAWKFDPLHQTPSALPFNVEQAQAYFRAVTVPVLLLEAGESPWRLLPDLDARRQCFSRRWLRVIEGAGHMVHHDAPADVAGHVVEFIDAVRSGRFQPEG